MGLRGVAVPPQSCSVVVRMILALAFGFFHCCHSGENVLALAMHPCPSEQVYFVRGNPGTVTVCRDGAALEIWRFQPLRGRHLARWNIRAPMRRYLIVGDEVCIDSTENGLQIQHRSSMAADFALYRHSLSPRARLRGRYDQSCQRYGGRPP